MSEVKPLPPEKTDILPILAAMRPRLRFGQRIASRPDPKAGRPSKRTSFGCESVGIHAIAGALGDRKLFELFFIKSGSENPDAAPEAVASV